MSRLVIIPLTDENPTLLGKDLSDAMDYAGQTLGQLVRMKGRMAQKTCEVQELSKKIAELLPEGEALLRLSQN